MGCHKAVVRPLIISIIVTDAFLITELNHVKAISLDKVITTIVRYHYGVMLHTPTHVFSLRHCLHR